MATIQRVYVLGLGAIGSVYAARLYEYDPEVLDTLRPEGKTSMLQDVEGGTKD